MSSDTNYVVATKNTSVGGGSDAEWRFAQRVNTDIATNLNNLTQTEIPVDGTMTQLGSGFSINGNGIQLTTDSQAWVKCSCSIHVTAAVLRANMIVRFARNGTLFGPVAAHGYIRNGNGHQESSYSLPGTWILMQPNDIITIESLREANAGTVTMASAGTSQFLLERLVNV